MGIFRDQRSSRFFGFSIKKMKKRRRRGGEGVCDRIDDGPEIPLSLVCNRCSEPGSLSFFWSLVPMILRHGSERWMRSQKEKLRAITLCQHVKHRCSRFEGSPVTQTHRQKRQEYRMFRSPAVFPCTHPSLHHPVIASPATSGNPVSRKERENT